MTLREKTKKNRKKKGNNLINNLEMYQKKHQQISTRLRAKREERELRAPGLLTACELTLVCHMSACLGFRSGICMPSRQASTST